MQTDTRKCTLDVLPSRLSRELLLSKVTAVNEGYWATKKLNHFFPQGYEKCRTDSIFLLV